MNLKKVALIFRKEHVLITLFLLCSATGLSQDLPRPSPQASITQRIGITDVSVVYHRPSMRGRTVWGQVVPYGYNSPSSDGSPSAPWRMGANDPTTIEFTHDLKVAGKEIKAGKYALFGAIFENGVADIIFSRNFNGWGSIHYAEEDVILKVNAEVNSLEHPVEQLTYAFDSVTNNTSILSVTWSDKQISIPLEVNTEELTYQSLLDHELSFDAINFGTKSNWHQNAALYLLNNRIHLDKALYWSNIAVNEQNGGIRNFPNLTTNVLLLALNNQQEEAQSLLPEALKLAPNLNMMMFFGRQANTFDLREIEKKNYLTALDMFPENANTWWVHFQLSQVYLADGEKDEFLKYIDMAIQDAPESFVDRIKNFKSQNT
ncbi:DUF2911 domain-containing protein [Roseivirga sp.]|uniref:DUF2911 domain-containing protein n=1 Tax=Roseivirga sp. TaxID=1964215 RepID=UPI003B5180B6